MEEGEDVRKEEEDANEDDIDVEPKYNYERNNSLPELFGDEAHQQSWEKYWAKNGERLIWQSWIEKYIDYINPEFLDQNNMPNLSNQTSADSQKLSLEEGQHAFTFEPPPTSTEIVISSPVKQSTEDLLIQGWNQISPDIDSRQLHNNHQNEESNRNRYLHQNSNSTDNDNLLSPRCDSINSSIPFTIGATTDSMTNVTRMTISSYGFESSSHVTSESTPSTESSKQHHNSNSISSFSDSDEDDNQMATTRAAYECEKLLMANKPEEHLPSSNDKDSEEYWQKRWQSHAQEQYVKHYNMFMETHRILQEEMSSSFKSDSGFLPGEKNVINSHHGDCSGDSSSHKKRKKSARKKSGHSLQRLVANLNLRNDIVKQAQIKPTEHTDSNNDNHPNEQSDSIAVIDTTEASLMESLGLPTAFGTSKGGGKSNGGNGNDPPDERPINLKRSHESESDEQSNNVDHIKSQFEMMGYAFVDKNSDPATTTTTTKGEIVYRKKHVRLHNRMLKMFPSASTKSRHTYFDDDGNEIVEEQEQQENLLHSSSDEDAPILQQQLASNRINNAIVPLTSRQFSSDGNTNEEEVTGVEEQVNINLSIDQEYDHVEESGVNNNNNDDERQSKREKKKKRKGKFQTIIPAEIANDKVLRKYWYKRFSLFSMYDLGIQLDRGEFEF